MAEESTLPNRRDLLAYLQRVRILEDPVDGEALLTADARSELEKYVRHHLKSAELSLAMLARYVSTDGSTGGRAPRVLELGGAPYYFSTLMHHVFHAELTAANVQAGAWPGDAPTITRGQVLLNVPEGTAKKSPDLRLPIEVRVFNIEKDPFPFADDTFDVVLCMEVLEHLGYSPSHMLAEAHRVLKPGGLMFITVPNFINLKRTVNMLFNRPCGYPYSGYGIYGRHQREYAPFEVAALLEACHYQVSALETANVWPTFRGNPIKGLGNALLNAVGKLPLPWTVAKREYILCAARAYGTPVVAYPAWLYEHRTLYPKPPNGVPASFD